MKYILGIKIGKTDRLSRQLDWKVEIEKDNNNQVVIKDYWLYSLLEVVIEELEINILEKIKIARSKNKEVIRVIEEIKKVEVKVLQGKE